MPLEACRVALLVGDGSQGVRFFGNTAVPLMHLKKQYSSAKQYCDWCRVKGGGGRLLFRFQEIRMGFTEAGKKEPGAGLWGR